MNRKYIFAAAVLLFFAALIAVSALVLLNGFPEDPPIETSLSSESHTVSVPQKPQISLPLYDGTFGSFRNGDSFYTPDKDHAVTDADRTVLYYNNLLVAFTDGDLSEEEQNAISQSIGGETVGIISGAIHAIQIRVNDSDLAGLEKLAAELMENESIIYACAEYPVQIMSTETDENPWGSAENGDILGDESNPGGNDWWAEAVGAYTAWEYSSLCGEVCVGIADNGFDADHQDLEGLITVVSGNGSYTPADHGTLVAGVIGALNNKTGLRGIADGAKLLCADLWPEDDPDSYHTMAEYLAVINYMVQNGAKVINNSWGCILPSLTKWEEKYYGEFTGEHRDEYRQWVQSRTNRDLVPTAEYSIVMLGQLISSGYDVLMVQAAGNGLDNGGSGTDARSIGFFAAVTEEVYNNMTPSVLEKLDSFGIAHSEIDEHILVVGAVLNERDPAGNYYMTEFSNYGDTVDICAPGANIFSTISGDFYGIYGGTSLSAPMVTGSAAFLWSICPELSVSEVRSLLLESANFRAVGFVSSEGWSYPMLNVGAAAERLLEKER